jgi:glutamine amidotransferase
MRVAASLAEADNSLAAQSRKDSRGQTHVDGWGLAWYDAASHDATSYDNAVQPRIEKSLRPAHDDPRFDELAKSVAATSLVAHVRQASVGSVALVNTHPFAHGRWVFAHNGTLQDFAARRAPLLAAIPDDLRQRIGGDTDSEHVFYFWLGELRAATGGLDRPLSVDVVTATLRQTVRLLDGWFPTHNGEESKFNFLATDGRLLAATRWRHMLSCREHRGTSTMATADRPIGEASDFRAVFIASEPTSGDGWHEVPDRSLVVVDQRFNIHTASLA